MERDRHQGWEVSRHASRRSRYEFERARDPSRPRRPRSSDRTTERSRNLSKRHRERRESGSPTERVSLVVGGSSDPPGPVRQRRERRGSGSPTERVSPVAGGSSDPPGPRRDCTERGSPIAGGPVILPDPDETALEGEGEEANIRRTTAPGDTVGVWSELDRNEAGARGGIE